MRNASEIKVSIYIQGAATYMLYLEYEGDKKGHYELSFHVDDLHIWAQSMVEKMIELANSIITKNDMKDYSVLDVSPDVLDTLHEQGLKGRAWSI